jgi:hypothetical protein
MRSMLLLVILPVMALGPAAHSEGLELALDGAGDLSPVYPTATIPANVRQFVVIFTYPDLKRHQIGTHFEPIDATGSFTINAEAHAEAAAVGEQTRFLLRQSYLTDLPVGRWTLTASVDDQPVGRLEVKVVPTLAPLKLVSALDLAGSMTQGTEWTFQFRLLQEPAPGLKLTLDGIKTADPEGWLRTTLVRKTVSLDREGTRWDQLRTGKLVSSHWVVATDQGIAISKFRIDGDVQSLEPPELTVLMPTDEFHQSWQWTAKGADPKGAQRFQMWGPLPIKTPTGEQPGYVVLQKIPDDADPTVIASSIEYEIVPGIGLVHEVDVTPIRQAAATSRIEIDLTSMARGTGPEPGIRKYSELSAQ